MTQATALRRTYTTTRQNDDDSQSPDNSVMISSISSSTSSASESEKSTYSSKRKSSENIVKNTSNTEIGKSTKKYESEKSTQNISGSNTSSLSEYDEEIIEFFEKLKAHNDPKTSKRGLVEELIRSNATRAFMRDMNKISDKEIVRLQGNKVAKWSSIFVSGALSQNTSFFVASELATYFNQPWLFPVVSTILSEGLSDKLAALTRRTTFMTDDAKHLYRKQDLIARAIGDMIRQYYLLKPEAKHRSNNPTHKGERFTAWDALWKDSDYFLIVTASNWINRGLPFICFTATNLARDSLLKGILKGAPGWQTFLLRWGAGVIAGGSTALLNQSIASRRKGAKEIPGYSTSYWHAKETFLHSVRQDIRDRLNEANELTDTALKTKLEKLLLDLDKKIQREIGVAGLKKSTWTAIPGEIKASAHRSRPEDSLDPEAPGTRAQSIHNALGKFLSLIHFTYWLDQAMRSENGTDSFSASSALNLMVLPFALIFTGYMFRDDLQIISKIFSEVKGAVQDVTTGYDTYQERTAKPLDDVTTNIPEQINTNGSNGNDNDNDADNKVTSNTKVRFAEKLSEEILTDREREARDRKREFEKTEDASTTASYSNKNSGKMSESADTDSDNDSSEDDSQSSRSIKKETASPSPSNQFRTVTEFGDSSSSEYT